MSEASGLTQHPRKTLAAQLATLPGTQQNAALAATAQLVNGYPVISDELLASADLADDVGRWASTLSTMRVCVEQLVFVNPCFELT